MRSRGTTIPPHPKPRFGNLFREFRAVHFRVIFKKIHLPRVLPPRLFNRAHTRTKILRLLGISVRAHMAQREALWLKHKRHTPLVFETTTAPLSTEISMSTTATSLVTNPVSPPTCIDPCANFHATTMPLKSLLVAIPAPPCKLKLTTRCPEPLCRYSSFRKYDIDKVQS